MAPNPIKGNLKYLKCIIRVLALEDAAHWLEALMQNRIDRDLTLLSEVAMYGHYEEAGDVRRWPLACLGGGTPPIMGVWWTGDPKRKAGGLGGSTGGQYRYEGSWPNARYVLFR